MAERFVEMAEDSNHKATTVIPANLKNAIYRMMERSKNAKIKVPVSLDFDDYIDLDSKEDNISEVDPDYLK